MNGDRRIPAGEWETVVRNVPIVSVDLVVRAGPGVVLGRRRNQPARGEWFVPGGRLVKGERLREAVHRVAREELGVDVEIAARLGVYEHLYDATEVPGVAGKHYVPVAFEVTATSTAFAPDDQHGAIRVFDPPFEGLDLHPYVETYLRDAGVID